MLFTNLNHEQMVKIDGGVGFMHYTSDDGSGKRILRKKRFVSEEFRIFKNPKQVGKLHKK